MTFTALPSEVLASIHSASCSDLPLLDLFECGGPPFELTSPSALNDVGYRILGSLE